MKDIPPLIGTATELVGDERRPQPCTGTFKGDVADPRFRFNVLFVEHDAPFPLHGHEYSELVIVLDGRSTHRTDLEDYPIAKGDVFVINRPRRHGFSDPEGLRLCNLQYDPQQFLAGHRELETLMGYHALFDLESRWKQKPPFRARLRLTPAQLVQAESLVRAIDEEFRGASPGRETMIRCLFLQLAVWLSRLYDAEKKRSASPVTRMAAAVAYTRAHYREPLRVEQLARITHLSPSQFQRVFRKTYRTTPMQMVNRIRIDEARELLKDARRDISAVARETGFASPSFFSTQFRRYTGVTPSAYRRQVLDAAEVAR